MANRGVRFKLLLLVGVAIAAFVGLGIYGIFNTTTTSKRVQDVYETAEEVRRASQTIGAPLGELRQLSLSIVLAPNPKLQEELARRQQALTEELDGNLANWRSGSSADAAGLAFQGLKDEWERYKRIKDVTLAKALGRYREEAFINVTGAERQQFEAVNQRLEEWMSAMIADADQVYEDASARNATVFLVSLIVTALLTLVVAGIGFHTTRSIVRPIETLKAAAARIARRETVGEIDVRSNDELGELARSMEAMAAEIEAFLAQRKASEANLVQIVSGLRSGIHILGSSVAEIVESTSAMSGRAGDAAVAVSQTSTTAVEIRHTAELASEKSRQVADMARQVEQTAQAGSHATKATAEGMQHILRQMEDIAAGMKRLSEQGRTIGQIITTVDDLADQSSVLAVNAAIEAAKAGESGRGFSVVAQEVKSLAAQSRDATRQVRSILNEIQRATASAAAATERGCAAVETGVQQSTQAGDSIHALASSLEQAAQSATEIAASSREQFTGMNQMAEALNQIREVSEGNAESARRLESAARKLDELGKELKGLLQ